MRFYFTEDKHTLASALREALERALLDGEDDSFVACTVAHPLDEHLEVDAPSAAAVRVALLEVKERIQRIRSRL